MKNKKTSSSFQSNCALWPSSHYVRLDAKVYKTAVTPNNAVNRDMRHFFFFLKF